MRSSALLGGLAHSGCTDEHAGGPSHKMIILIKRFKRSVLKDQWTYLGRAKQIAGFPLVLPSTVLGNLEFYPVGGFSCFHWKVVRPVTVVRYQPP